MAKCSVYLDLRWVSEMFGQTRTEGVLKNYATVLTSYAKTGKWIDNVFVIETKNLDDSITIANSILIHVEELNISRATRIPIKGCVCTLDDTISYQVMIQAFRLFTTLPCIYISCLYNTKTEDSSNRLSSDVTIYRQIVNTTGDIIHGNFTAQDEIIYAYIYDDDYVSDNITGYGLKDISSSAGVGGATPANIQVGIKYPAKLIDKCIAEKRVIVIHTVEANIQSGHKSLLSDSIIYRNLESLHLIAKRSKCLLLISPDLHSHVNSNLKLKKFIHEGQVYYVLPSPFKKKVRFAETLQTDKANVISNPTAKDVMSLTGPSIISPDETEKLSNIIASKVTSSIISNIASNAKHVPYIPTLPVGLPLKSYISPK